MMAYDMVAYDMVLKWRKGTDHIAPDALSRLRRKGPAEPEIETPHCQVMVPKRGRAKGLKDRYWTVYLSRAWTVTARIIDAQSEPGGDCVGQDLPS